MENIWFFYPIFLNHTSKTKNTLFFYYLIALLTPNYKYFSSKLLDFNMSVNDPILEALSFTLENDFNILTQSSPSSSTSSFSSTSRTNLLNATDKPSCSNSCKHDNCSKSTSGNSTQSVKSSIILGEEEKTTCPFPECTHFTMENICSSGNKKTQGELLSHLLVNHRLVIDNPDEIANLSKYLNYWKGRFVNVPISDFCVGFAMEEPPKPPEVRRRKAGKDEDNTDKADVKQPQETANKEGGDDRLYFMLSPALPEDSQLRKDLWKQRLNIILEVNRQEREDKRFSRRCLFCRDVISGNRTYYFKHMRDSHSFHIGQPDNLVFVEELLQLIEDKLNRLECLSCEHIFKDKVVLKEHMRKKQHRKINPKNNEYDRFYVVNYLEPGKTWETIELEDAEDERKEDEWLETPEEKERMVVCLFCKSSNSDFQKVLDHMKSEHFFDFTCATSTLDFYQKVKLVNFIRRTVYQNICLCCEECFEESSELLKHISEHKINGQLDLLPKPQQWNQPEYFFPTYEEDEFLTCLDSDEAAGNDDIVSSEDETNVIPEDMPHIDMKNRDFDLAGFAIKYHNQNPN